MAEEMNTDVLRKELVNAKFYYTKPLVEKVNHPKHYGWINGIECLDVAEHFNFNLGNAMKYIWRAPAKDMGEAEVDLRKAIFYLEREVQQLSSKQITHNRSKYATMGSSKRGVE